MSNTGILIFRETVIKVLTNSRECSLIILNITFLFALILVKNSLKRGKIFLMYLIFSNFQRIHFISHCKGPLNNIIWSLGRLNMSS